MKEKMFLKRNFKWMFAFAFVVMLTFVVGSNQKVLAASSVNMSFDKEYSGTATGSEKHKYYFICPKAGYVTISLRTSGDCLSWELLDSNYNSLAESLWVGGDNRYVYDLAAGTYEFDITTCVEWFVNDYTLSVHFQDADETYTYKNDMYIDVAAKEAIPFGKKITGQIALNDTIDYYRLVIPAQGTLNISYLSDITTNFELRNAQDNIVTYLEGNAGQSNQSLTLKKGVYYLRFSSKYKTGTYYFIASFKMKGQTAETAKSVSTTSLKVTAKKPGDIAGYNIRYKKGSGSWKTITVNGNKNLNKTISKVTPGTYKVQIRTYCILNGKKYYSDWSQSKTVSCILKKPTSVSVKNSSSKALKITAKRSETITGYNIRYKKGSGSWKNVTVKGNKSLNKTIKGLSKGSAYKVQVRAYYKVSGKNYYSSWSTSKSVKINK